MVKIKISDIVVCNKNWIETEFVYSSRFRVVKNHNGRDPITILSQGKKYRVEDISYQLNPELGNPIYQIKIKNDIGELYWCDVNRFNTIKELRRMKIKKLQKSV